LKTKAYLAARGIPVAKLYGRIESRDQLLQFDFSQLPNECVLKPNLGYGGEGIVLLRGRDKHGRFLRNGKKPITDQELREHIEDILDGKFSLKGRADTAFFEQILHSHSCFAKFRPVGLPDLRIIVFNLVPVMAMARIPTIHSDGKANIHLGGLGIGIDIAKGTTTHVAQYHGILKELPSGGGSPSGHQIPYWDEILLICSKIQQITNIGYLAVDIALDENMGPVLLEVNARAGLMVQVANLAPLRARLKRVTGIKVESPEKGVRLGQDLFGSKTKKAGAPNPNAKTTLGIEERISITLGDGSSISLDAKIASDQERTVFSKSLITELQKKNGALHDDTEGLYRVKFTLGGKKIQTLVCSETLPGTVKAVIGSRDLSGFLIDPSKKSTAKPQQKSVQKTDLRAVDRLLGQLDKDLLLLKHIKPINLDEETKRLKEDALYNPTFLYAEIDSGLDEAKKRLSETVKDESALGVLLEKKRKELLLRVALLENRGNNTAFTEASEKLFGKPTKALLALAQQECDLRSACAVTTGKPLSAEKAQKRFKEILEKYALHDWTVSIRQKLVSRVTVGGKNVYIRADALFSEEDIASLIAHEIETHVLTSENGSHQPYLLLRRGCANYLDTQEGLAIYNERGILSPFAEKRYNAPKNILGLQYSLLHPLSQTRTYLETELGYTPERAMQQCISMKRGLGDTSEPGGFTKSIVYYRGLKSIEKFVEDGGDLKRLYIGKIALEDLKLTEDLPEIKTPLILPDFLR